MNKREEVLDAMQEGNIVAFVSSDKMVAAKVIVIEQDFVMVETKNKSVYEVQNKDIVWVKTGSRWPIGIYNALKLNKKEGNQNGEVNY